MSLRVKRLDRMTRMLKILGARSGSEASGVQNDLMLGGDDMLTIDTIQRDLNHLCDIGLVSRTRCCGDPYWFTLTELGRRIWATYTPQEA